MIEWIIATIVVIGIAVVITIFMRRMRRRHQQAVALFENGPRMSQANYLNALDITPDTERSKIATWFRNLIAEAGHIPVDAVLPQHRIWKDYKDLPFGDGPDMYEFVFKIERQLSIKFPRSLLKQVFPCKAELTMKDITMNLIEQVEKIQSSHQQHCGFNRPGVSFIICGLILFSITIMIAFFDWVLIYLFDLTGWLSRCCLWVGIIPGILAVICWGTGTVVGQIAWHRDRKLDKRCDDCGALMRCVKTWGSDSPGQRWDGYGFYCPKCRELK